MIIFYLIAIIPIIICSILFVMKREITCWEFIITSLLAFVVSGIMHYVAIKSMTSDKELLSGKVISIEFHPEWVEQYTEIHTKVVGSGKNSRIETYTTTEYRTHEKEWVAYIEYGLMNDNVNISKKDYDDIKYKFGGNEKTIEVNKSGYYSGDKNIYIVNDELNYYYPTVTNHCWENRIKGAGPSIFSFCEIPEDIKLPDYPYAIDWKVSRRLIGDAFSGISILEWDRMCSRLGSCKKVNVILVGFGNKDSIYAHYLQSKWIGGKKNDLVICYGGTNEKPTWVYCFGWTERDLVKRNIESIILKSKINNDLIFVIENEINENYVIKDWSKFDYITIEPPLWSYIFLIIFMVITQSIAIYISYCNKAKK